MIMVPWCSGYHVALSRRRSRVRFPSGPYDSLAQLVEHVNSHHKNNSVMIMVPWCSGYHVALSRRRSRVRFPSGPYDSLAQLVEQLTFNQWVTGSSPVRVIILCGFGGIGRRTRFRIWRLTAWGFKSLNPH